MLATLWGSSEGTLLEVNGRRSSFLIEALCQLGLEDRVRVLTRRAETAGRDGGLRGRFDAVVARSFGPPAVTTECGAPFLRSGGLLVVSEPPPERAQTPGFSAERPDSPAGGGEGVVTASDPLRWPEGPLGLLSMKPIGFWYRHFGYQMLRQAEICPERFPRRVGIPHKRPLWRSDRPSS